MKGFEFPKNTFCFSDGKSFSFMKIDLQKVKEIQKNTEECKEMIEKWLKEA
jgi:hypothetical protein